MNKIQVIVKPSRKDPNAVFVFRYESETQTWTAQMPPAPEIVTFGELHSILNSPILPRIVREALRDTLAGAGLVEWLA
jgi:hypothetical protein